MIYRQIIVLDNYSIIKKNSPIALVVNGRLTFFFGIFFFTNVLIPFAAWAQKDTLKKISTIDINSVYKPVLRNSVKINFSATHLNADTTLPTLTYKIPAQNLFYSYQPFPLKPLALKQDTNLYFGLRNYVKVGYGNFSSPYIDAAFSFGDGKNYLVNLYANYISAKGKLLNQDYLNMHIKLTGSYFIKNNELYTTVDANKMHVFLYGYDTSMYHYSKKDVRQQVKDFQIKFGVRNTYTGSYGIKYNPSIMVSSFTNLNKLSETTFILNAPLEKNFGKVFTFKLEAKLDITSYTTKNLLLSNIKISNNFFQLLPSLIFSTPRFKIHGGIEPTWDNGKFVMMPNVFAEAFIKEHVFAFEAGWVGRYTKNTYSNLFKINPYLKAINAQLNTKELEYYWGIKATMTKHFNFNAKAGYVTYQNLPFFINDTAADNKSFVISNEVKVKSFKIHGDISYINKEKFTATGSLTLNGYTGMNSNAKAWHTIPMEFTSSLRWWAFKQVLLKVDFYVFGTGHYLTKGNISKTYNSGSDLSAGIEFKINKTFSAWMDINNILNNKYERWHNYQVYGFNLMGGVRAVF